MTEKYSEEQEPLATDTQEAKDAAAQLEQAEEIAAEAAGDDVLDEDDDFDRDGQVEAPVVERRQPKVRVRNPSRRTIAREARRRRSRAKKARKRTVYMILGGMVALALILGLALPSFGSLINPQQNTGADATGETASVGTAVEIQPISELADGEVYTAYISNPPTSGPSYAEGVEWGVHDAQQPNEAVVRNLGQGAVVVNHNLQDDAQVADLTSYLEAQPGYPGCFVLQPHSAVAVGEVTLASWGWTETYTGVDRPGMQLFVADHLNDGPLFVGQTCGADTTLPAEQQLDHEGNPVQ